MLATAGALPADDDAWAYEVKWDGVRALVAVDGGRLTVTSRNGNDVTSSYPELARSAGSSAPPRSCSTARSSPRRARPHRLRPLQSRMHVARPSAALRRDTPVQLLLFDVLHLEGASLLDRSYDEPPGGARRASGCRRALVGPAGLPRRRRGGARGDQARRASRASSPSGAARPTCRAGAATTGASSSTSSAPLRLVAG
jgi:hypothetical protein